MEPYVAMDLVSMEVKTSRPVGGGAAKYFASLVFTPVSVIGDQTGLQLAVAVTADSEAEILPMARAKLHRISAALGTWAASSH